MALLRQLRVVERLAGLLEIGAGILPVGVEEEVVEAGVEVVVARDVLLRPRAAVALVQAAKRDPRPIDRLDPRERRKILEVLRAEIEKLIKRAFGDDDAPVHEEFAEVGRGIDQKLALRRPVHEASPRLSARPRRRTCA